MFRVLNQLIDLVLPKFCVGCVNEGTWLCDNCASLIQIPREQHCPFCEVVTAAGRTCEEHHSAALSGCLAAGYYHDPLLRDALHRYKYEFAEDLAPTLAAHLARMAQKFHTVFPRRALIIPLPLTATKLRERGFNQTLALATAIANTLSLPLATILIRTRDATPQAQLAPDARRTNLTNAFAVTDTNPVRGQSILLVDDVLTTGTTMEAAATVLKFAGANEIFGLVLARG